MLNVNNWVGVGIGNWVASYNNIKFLIALDSNSLYDITATIKLGNADFFSQINDLETLDKAKEAADSIAIKAYNLSPISIKTKVVTQAEREAQARRAAAIKKYSEASKQWGLLLMSMVNCISPKLDDFLNDPNYVWIPKDPSGKVIDLNNPRPRPI